MKNLTTTKQSKTTLKTLNGIRVLSLCWVCCAHVFVFITYTGMLDNILEFNRHIVDEHPWMLFIVNGTVSVDSFFIIGGMLSGYLLVKRFRKIKSDEYLSICCDCS